MIVGLWCWMGRYAEPGEGGRPASFVALEGGGMLRYSEGGRGRDVRHQEVGTLCQFDGGALRSLEEGTLSRSKDVC